MQPLSRFQPTLFDIGLNHSNTRTSRHLDRAAGFAPVHPACRNLCLSKV